MPEAVDRLEGPAWTYYRARIYALNGDAAQALPLIRHLIATQDRASVFGEGNIRLEPYWDAIREDPGFKAVLANPPEPKP